MKHILILLTLFIASQHCFAGIALHLIIENKANNIITFRSSIDGTLIDVLTGSNNVDTFLTQNEDKQHFFTIINNVPLHLVLFRKSINNDEKTSPNKESEIIKIILCHDKNGPKNIYFLQSNTDISCSLIIGKKAQYKLYLSNNQKQYCTMISKRYIENNIATI